ncbi:MAG: adenylosuccinate synthase [Mycolicibacterium cosmeticum]|nr:adenylosuccinate synthase [Mycolicibacterium cosmeticum]
MPEIPESAPKPQDHQKKKSAAARKAEAEGFVTIEQCGVSLKIPIGGKIPLAAYLAFEAEDELGGTKLLLGDEQWQAFLAANPTLDDFAEVGEKLQAAAGN